MPNAVLVFVAQGCGHCEEYLPRFKRVAVKYRAFVPMRLIDLASGNPWDQALANLYHVAGTPATIMVKPDGKLVRKIEGSVGDGQIATMMEEAAKAP